ncbi:MAG: hydroxyacid dehydrogenase, partial [Planctomycetota bacterium]|nr:hydroxyacid dehydrogenase [Planctomycetota bacterium]
MKILIADKFEDVGIDALKDLGCTVEFQPELTTDDLPGALGEHAPDILVVRSTKVPAPVFDASDALKLVIRAGAGYDTIDTDAAGARGVSVANCPGMNSTAVAELAMGFMLALDRRIPQQTADLRGGVWAKKAWAKYGRGLKGRTLGLIGVGQIGRLVARRALAFEMKILYQDIVPCEELDNHPDAQRVEREELLKNSDIVSLHVPAIPETKNLINADTLALMQPHAYLINTTRGSVVDQPALAAALKNGTIGGAALDVYADEPKAEDKTIDMEILSLPNFIGTHHVGASTEQAQVAVAEEAVRIVQQFKETGEVLHCVNADALAAAAT